MKKLFCRFGLPALLLVQLYFSGCDKVDAPYKTKSNADTTACVFSDTAVQPRIVFLEDFTGHTCGNCPRANDKGLELKNTYGEQLVVMALHTGSYTTPQPPQMPYDFRNPVADELNVIFQLTDKPRGMVNRKGFPASLHKLAFTNWGTEITNSLALPADANIFLENKYSTADKKLTVCIKTKWINTLSGDFKLAVYLTEDSIVKPQLDYRLPAGQDTIFAYIHRHVLRTAVNSAFGDALPASSAGTSDERSFSLTLGTDWVPEHCVVVAIVYNATTYEVVQASEKKMVK